MNRYVLAALMLLPFSNSRALEGNFEGFCAQNRASAPAELDLIWLENWNPNSPEASAEDFARLQEFLSALDAIGAPVNREKIAKVPAPTAENYQKTRGESFDQMTQKSPACRIDIQKCLRFFGNLNRRTQFNEKYIDEMTLSEFQAEFLKYEGEVLLPGEEARYIIKILPSPLFLAKEECTETFRGGDGAVCRNFYRERSMSAALDQVLNRFSRNLVTGFSRFSNHCDHLYAPVEIFKP